MESNAYCMDCMEALREMPDNAYDLAIVDPPYGHAVNGVKFTRSGHGWADKYGAKINQWDTAPGEDYFRELFRVSKNQIIWGGNYFSLPPTRCFLVWDKYLPEKFTMAMAEYAWTSFNEPAKIFYHRASLSDTDRFHPTQKPVGLYAWCLSLYGRIGNKILDTHMGSGSLRIACWDAGLDYTGYEIDPEYFALEEKRFRKHRDQVSLWE